MNALPTTITDKIGKLIPRLSSNHAGEVIAVVEALKRCLATENLDLNDLSRVITGSPSNTAGRTDNGQDFDPVAAAQFCLASPVAFDDREVKFLLNIEHLIRRGYRLTAKQVSWLEALHLRARRRAAA
jgi:hypothetical protein